MEWSGSSLIFDFLLPSVVLFPNMFLPQTLSFFLSSLRCSTAEIDRGGILMNCLPFLCLSAFLACSPNFLVEMLRLVSVLSPFYILLEIDKYLGLHKGWYKFPIFGNSYPPFMPLLFWFGCVCSNHPKLVRSSGFFLSLANLVNDHASDSVFFKLHCFSSI